MSSELAEELAAGAAAMAELSRTEDEFRAAFDAFRAADRDSFRRLLDRHKLVERCRLVCEWIRSKECVLVCLELAGPPTEQIPDLREFVDAVVRITGDEELVEQLAQSVTDRDPDRFRIVLRQAKAEALGHVLCRWVCGVRSRLLCRVVCSPQPVQLTPLEEELTAAGRAVSALLADPEALAQVQAAMTSGAPNAVRDILARLRLTDQCHLVCEWLCAWRCVRFCLPVAVKFPPAGADLSEAYEFAQVTARLADNPDALGALADAMERGDSAGFTAAVDGLELGRFAVQLCHWVCGWMCLRWCRIVCPPVLTPWFTQVGHFDIYGDIDSATGRTNKALGYSGLYYGGGPDFAFTGCLELRGFCPAASPIDGTPMRYRFLLVGSLDPLTGSRVCPVDAGTRRVLWPVNAGGIASAAQVLTFQSITIQGAPAADTPPPAPGDPWFGPPAHVIAADADGWIQVDPASVAGGFAVLIGFNSPDVVPGGIPPAPPPVAGSPVPAVDQKNGTDLGLIFQATRVTGPTSPPDSSNTLAKIHINNWAEVNLLDVTEFHTGGGTACTGITTALHVEYTTDHAQMRAWEAVITSAALGSPVIVAGGPDALHPRGDAAVAPVAIGTFPPCSYTVTLSTRAGLTTGLIDNTGRSQQKTFCVR